MVTYVPKEIKVLPPLGRDGGWSAMVEKWSTDGHSSAPHTHCPALDDNKN